MSTEERGRCHFTVTKLQEGKTAIRMELFRDDIPALQGRILSFEFISGTSQKDARKLMDTMNEWILEAVVSEKP